jgi:hypothetical protein
MKRKPHLKTYIVTGIMLFLMTGCGKSSEDENAFCTGAWDTCEVFYQDRVALAKGNFWGYVDRQGEEVLDFIYDEAAAFVRGVAVVAIDESKNLIDLKGTLLLEGDYHTLIRDVDDEIIIYGNDLGYGLMAEDGTLVTQPIYEAVSGGFSSGLLAVSVAGKSGYCDKTGTLIVPAVYETSYEFTSGYGLIQGINGDYGYVNAFNEIVIAVEYQDAYSFDSYGRAIVQNDDLSYDLIDKNGDPVIEGVDDITGKGPLYKVSDGGALYLYESNGSRFVDRAYDLVTIYYDYLVNLEWSEGETDYDEVILFNPDGTVSRSLPYLYADPILGTDLKTYLVDERGDAEVIIYSYDFQLTVAGTGIHMITDEHLVVKNGSGVGVMTLESHPKTVIPFEYQNILLLSDGYGIAQKNDFLGIIDLKGNEIVPFIYASMNRYPNI